MPADTPATTAPAWQGTDVDTATIRQELTRAVHDAALATVAGKEDRIHSTRTRVLNLVVYAAGQEAMAEVSETIAGLCPNHSSRAIIISADLQSQQSRIDATVSASCTAGATTDTQIYTEEIRLTAHGDVAEHVDSIIAPLLVAGLPVFVWWPGDPPTQHQLLEQMAELCDRLVVDSAGFANTVHDLSALAQVAQERHAQCAFSDINWARLTPWRELTAQMFDPDTLRGFLGHIRTVRIGFRGNIEPSAMPSSQALLYACWLCSRLSWTPGKVDGSRLVCRTTAGEETAIEFVPEAPETPAAKDDGDEELTQVRLDAEDGQRRASFLVLRDPGSDEITTRVEIDGTPFFDRTGHFATRSTADLLCEELEVFGHDDVYEASLNLVPQIV